MEFSKLSPSKRLDIVLKHIDNLKPIYFIGIGELWTQLKQLGYILTEKDLFTILKKLEKDEFIHSFDRPVQTHIPQITLTVYFSTFEGQSFLEIENGYEGRLKTEKLKNKNAKVNKLTNTILSGIGGALLVYILATLQTCQDKKPQHVVLDSLKIPTYDTVFLINQIGKKDTSLVKIIKQFH